MNDDREFSKTTLGMIRAMSLIAERNAQPRPSKRYGYAKGGTAVHAKRPLSDEQAEQVNAITAKMRDVETEEQLSELMTQLARYPVKLVPMKRRVLLDRSRYTAEKLREIRENGGGKKEQERALKRALGKGTVDIRPTPNADLPRLIAAE